MSIPGTESRLDLMRRKVSVCRVACADVLNVAPDRQTRQRSKSADFLGSLLDAFKRKSLAFDFGNFMAVEPMREKGGGKQDFHRKFDPRADPPYRNPPHPQPLSRVGARGAESSLRPQRTGAHGTCHYNSRCSVCPLNGQETARIFHRHRMNGLVVHAEAL